MPSGHGLLLKHETMGPCSECTAVGEFASFSNGQSSKADGAPGRLSVCIPFLDGQWPAALARTFRLSQQ